MLKFDRKTLIIASCYVAFFTLLVFYKFNFIFPSADNEFMFSGDFVRPITTEAAISYYLNPFILGGQSSTLDVTAPLRIAYWSVILSIAQVLPLNVVYWLLIIATHVGGALLVAISAGKILKNTNKKRNLVFVIAGLFPALFFLFSYPVNYRPYWLFLPLLPAILFYILAVNFDLRQHARRLFTREKLVLIGLGYLSILQPHLYLLIAASAVIFVLMELFLKKIHKLPISKEGWSSARMIFWYSIPFMLLLIPLGILQQVYDVEISPTYNYNLSVLRMMSVNGDFSNALTFSNGFWEKVVFTDLDKALILFMVVAAIAIALIFATKERTHRPMALAAVITFAVIVTFELGYNNPLYQAMADPSVSVSWILRDPMKISLAALGLFLFVSSLGLRHLLNSSETTTYMRLPKPRLVAMGALMIPLVISMIIWGPVQKTSEILAPSRIPDSYFETAALERTSDGPLIYLPDSGTRFSWGQNENLESSFLAKTNSESSSGETITANPYGKQLLHYALKTADTSVLNIAWSGVVIDDSLEASKYQQTVGQFLSVDETTNLGGDLHFLDAGSFSPVRIQSADPIYILDSVNYAHLKDLPASSHPMVFYDPTYSAILNATNHIMVPLKSSSGDPANDWAKGYSHNPLHGDWHYYLERFGIENWQSDYDSGIVFTWSPMSLPPNTVANDAQVAWNFNSMEDVSDWATVNLELQNRALQVLEHQEGTMLTTVWNHTAGWKIVKSPKMDVINDHFYLVKIDSRGENAKYLHSKLVEYDSQHAIINTIILNVLGDGTFGWKSNTYDYSPSNEDVAYVQLQLWHGDNSSGAIPSKIWIDNVGIYDLTSSARFESLEIPFSIDRSGDYQLLVRYFKSHAGDAINLHLGDQDFSFNSLAPVSKFVWEEVTLHDLQAGQHAITLENIGGFNAVNLIALVPQEEYLQAKENVAQELSAVTLLHPLRADLDLNYTNARLDRISDSPHRKLHFGSNGWAWQEIEIVRDGTYALAIKGNGDFQLELGGTVLEMSSNDDLTSSQPFSLSKGKYILLVSGEESFLDLIWLYSAERPGTFEQVFAANDSDRSVISYEKLSPVQWKMNVRASDSSTIALAEYYDPFWEARVYNQGELVEVVKPVQLYGALNGFVINSVGDDLEVDIQYTIQDGFNAAMAFSLSCFALVFAYLVFEWRKGPIDFIPKVIFLKLVERGIDVARFGENIHTMSGSATNEEKGYGRSNV